MTVSKGWDATVNDLSKLKLSKSEILRRRENAQRYSPAQIQKQQQQQEVEIQENIDWNGLESVLEAGLSQSSEVSQGGARLLRVNQQVCQSGVKLAQSQVDIDDEISRFQLSDLNSTTRDERASHAVAQEPGTSGGGKWPEKAANRLSQALKAAYPENKLASVNDMESLMDTMAFIVSQTAKTDLNSSLRAERIRLELHQLKRGQDKLFAICDDLQTQLHSVQMKQATNTDDLRELKTSVDKVTSASESLQTTLNDIEYQMCAETIAKTVQSALFD